MDLYSAFATDETKENEGAWFPVPGGDAEILVARSTNEPFMKAVSKAFEKYAKVADSLEVEARQEKEYRDLVARHVLKGWRNVQFRGTDYPYSFENARALMNIKDFRVFVKQCSDTFEAYKAEIETEVGNA